MSMNVRFHLVIYDTKAALKQRLWRENSYILPHKLHVVMGVINTVTIYAFNLHSGIDQPKQ